MAGPGTADPEGEGHWAWSELEQPALPDPAGGQARTPVDHFIFTRMVEAGVKPAPEADPRALLRRVHLDLTGLPPTPAEVEKFLREPGDEAYARVVDDLLSRPQYGERWGRHWLDVVRYAESKGYERDEYKKFVWRYRDYVIESFNRDKPYDQFILEQIAGDELDDANLESEIATTFLALGTFDTIAADREVAVYDTLDDIVATTSMAFLGQTLQCARCHDHKFEPFSQKDYYRVLAAFESLNVTSKERQLGTEEDRKRHREAEEAYRRETLEPRRKAEERFWLPILKRWSKEGLLEGRKVKLNDKQLTLTIEAIPLSPDKRSKEQRNMLEKERNRVRSAVRELATEEERSKIAEHEQGLKAVEKDKPQPMMGWVYSGNARPKPTHLRVRGDVHQKGEEIPFGVPVVLDGGGLPEPRPTGQSSGRRRALAEWITGPQAPLAARVMSNRIWQYHFGRGLVEDGNNLGMAGGFPHQGRMEAKAAPSPDRAFVYLSPFGHASGTWEGSRQYALFPLASPPPRGRGDSGLCAGGQWQAEPRDGGTSHLPVLRRQGGGGLLGGGLEELDRGGSLPTERLCLRQARHSAPGTGRVGQPGFLLQLCQARGFNHRGAVPPDDERTLHQRADGPPGKPHSRERGRGSSDRGGL